MGPLNDEISVSPSEHLMSSIESPEVGIPRSQPQHVPLRLNRFSVSNLSIKQRLPLLIGILLFGIIAISTWASYRGVKESALEVSVERLRFLTQHLATMFQQSFSNIASNTATTANDPAIRAYLHKPQPATQDPVLEILEQFTAPKDRSCVQVELWNANGSLVLTLPEGSSQIPSDLDPEFNRARSGPLFSAVGEIRMVRDTIAYPLVVAVRDEAGEPIGYLVRWRKLVATAEGRQQLVDLIGAKASLYLGNHQGDLWTDLLTIAPKPPVDVRSAQDVVRYTREGNSSVVAQARPINGTPFLVLVEFGEQGIFVQADRFLQRMAVIGVVLLAIGLGLALALSHSITRPLNSLTKASAAIADGDYSRPLVVHTRDELGELGSAFNAMVVRVRDSQHELEVKVQERTAQLEAANKELEAFSYSVSHDLRAPLRHINGFSQALLEDYADKLDDEGKGHLHQLRSASQEMAKLIDDMLQLARVTRTDMHRETVNLSELARAVISKLQAREPQRSVVVDIEDSLTTNGDRRLLEIMLSNLLGNAWKFTSKKRNPQIVFGKERKHDQDVYFVRDNGAGFDMEYADKLFGAFQRLHSPNEFEGTGIGLATIQRIILRHGGQVFAEGVVDSGATFYFTLANFNGEAA